MKKLIILGASILCALSFALTGCDDTATCKDAANNYIKISLEMIPEGSTPPTDEQITNTINALVDTCENGDDDNEPWSQEIIDCKVKSKDMTEMALCGAGEK